MVSTSYKQQDEMLGKTCKNDRNLPIQEPCWLMYSQNLVMLHKHAEWHTYSLNGAKVESSTAKDGTICQSLGVLRRHLETFHKFLQWPRVSRMG